MTSVVIYIAIYKSLFCDKQAQAASEDNFGTGSRGLSMTVFLEIGGEKRELHYSEL